MVEATGLEPTTHGLGNRPNPLAQLGSGLDLPNHLPNWGSKRPIGSAQEGPGPTPSGDPSDQPTQTLFKAKRSSLNRMRPYSRFAVEGP